MLSKAKTLKGYKLDSLDGEIGKVKEFYFDDQHWAIRYLIIDTRNWWPGKKVLISPQWIDRVSWDESKSSSIFPAIPLSSHRNTRRRHC